MSDRLRQPGLKPRIESLEDRSVPAVIGGTVYHDSNSNGLIDGSEAGIGGVTLRLQDAAGNHVATTVSNASGQYRFTQRDGVATGPQRAEYTANFTSDLTDLTRSAGVNKFDPSLGTLTRVEIIATGSMTSDATIENMSRHGATVKTDLKGQMSFQIQGVANTLSATLNDMETAVVGAFDGQADLAGSSAKQMQAQATGSFQTLNLTDTASLQAFIGSGQLQVAQQASANACACGSGNLLAAVETQAVGSVKVVYHYTPSNGIGPGSYRIVETQPSGYADGRETRDNITVITGSERTDVIEVGVVNQNDQVVTNHFGEVRAASIAGYVYHDVNKNGAYAAGDRMISNVLITLTGTDMFGNAISRTTRTSASGAFSFGALNAGTYTLTQSQPAGYLQGTNRAGNAGGVVSGDTIADINLSSGQNATNYSFGEVLNTTTPPKTTTPPPQFNKFRYVSRIRWN